MWLGFRLRRFARRTATLVLCAGAIIYFGYHAVEGNYGLRSYERLSLEVEALEDRHAALKAERMRLEHRVSLLRPESLDPDMLEERARTVLGLAHPNDVIVIDPQ